MTDETLDEMAVRIQTDAESRRLESVSRLTHANPDDNPLIAALGEIVPLLSQQSDYLEGIYAELLAARRRARRIDRPS